MKKVKEKKRKKLKKFEKAIFHYNFQFTQNFTSKMYLIVILESVFSIRIISCPDTVLEFENSILREREKDVYRIF